MLHQKGNHGPAYYRRYPPAFERFTPVCTTNQLNECSREAIVNAYDNAILYTDAFLAQVIALLKKNDPHFETAMIYMGDHGESLGEQGIYLHGLPYAMAPGTTRSIFPPFFGSVSASKSTNRPSALRTQSVFPMTICSTRCLACWRLKAQPMTRSWI